MVAEVKKNVVLFGLGNMGRNHFRVLEADPRFNLVAVIDPKAESLRHDKVKRETSKISRRAGCFRVRLCSCG